MPRYLTPSRICLLVLIDLYLADQASTSAKLEVLSFIAAHIRQPTSREFEGDDVTSSDLSLSVDATAFSSVLGRLASIVPGRTIYDVFISKLWHLAVLDTLHVLFDRLADLTPLVDSTPEAAKGKLSRASPLGQYVRRCNVEFTRLQFADSQSLWTAFEAYRAPTHESWAARNPDAAVNLDSYLASISGRLYGGQSADSLSSSTYAFISAEDTDCLMTFSIQQLQKLGTRMPVETKTTLRRWITDQSDSGLQSLQHFLAFFESWRAGQYTMALENLHRYFDYSLVVNNSTLRADNNTRVYYQYALLHLSVLHADFDCWSESVDAMEECIATARENQDTACLNFALSWLLYLRQAGSHTNSTAFESVGSLIGGVGSGQDEIAFLKTKAKETRHWSLMSSTLLEESKLEMYASGSNGKSMEHILQSGYLNVQHDLWILMPASALFQGASLDRLGQAHLATKVYQTITSVHHHRCPLGDQVRAICRMAYSLARCGQYSLAMRTLDDLASSIEGVLKLEQRVVGFTLLVEITRNLQCHDLIGAEYQLSQLRILRKFTDPELGFEISMVELEYLIECEDFDHALLAVNNHLRRLRNAPGSDIAQRLQLLVTKARLLAIASQPTKALSIALRAASTAHRCLVVPVLLEAAAVLVLVLSDLEEFLASNQLVEAILPMVIEARNVRLTAELFAAQAEAHVGIAGGKSGAEQARIMRLAEGFVERSRESYASVKNFNGVLDCLAMKARLARWRDDDATANLADQMSVQMLAERA